MTKRIDFYFDIVSPYTFIASRLIADIVARYDAELIWKPCLLGGIFKTIGSISAPGLVPYKKPYLHKDLLRLSKHLKITLNMPPDFPVKTVLAMRVLTGLPKENLVEAIHTLFNAYWVENLNIADAQVLIPLLGQDAVDRAGEQLIKDQLITLTSEAVQRGVFGAPTFFVDDEMFFGHDRMDLLEEHLKGNL